MRIIKVAKPAGLIAFACIVAAATTTKIYGQFTPDEEKHIAEVNAILESEPHVWLRAQRAPGVTDYFKGGIVSWRGFFREEDLTKERLAALNKAPIALNPAYGSPKNLRPATMEVIRYDDPERPNLRCAAILQTVLVKGKNTDSEKIKQSLEEYRVHAPEYPLDDNCQAVLPFEEGSNRDKLFITSSGPAFRSTDGIVHIDEGLRCGQFAEVRKGNISLPRYPKIQLTQWTNGVREVLPAVEVARRSFSNFSHGFASGLSKSGRANAQFIFGDHLDHRPLPITLDFWLLEDEASDEFCFVGRIQQDTAILQMVERIPRSGRHLGWKAYERGKKSWLPRLEPKEFGMRLADAVAAADAENSVGDGNLSAPVLRN